MSQNQPILSQGSQSSQSSVTFWPKRDQPMRLRYSKRQTTLRPVTFVRNWEQISPIPAIVNNTGQKTTRKEEVLISQGDGTGTVHSKTRKSPVAVAVPAYSEPLFEEEEEKEDEEEQQEEAGEGSTHRRHSQRDRRATLREESVVGPRASSSPQSMEFMETEPVAGSSIHSEIQRQSLGKESEKQRSRSKGQKSHVKTRSTPQKSEQTSAGRKSLSRSLKDKKNVSLRSKPGEHLTSKQKERRPTITSPEKSRSILEYLSGGPPRTPLKESQSRLSTEPTRHSPAVDNKPARRKSITGGRSSVSASTKRTRDQSPSDSPDRTQNKTAKKMKTLTEQSKNKAGSRNQDHGYHTPLNTPGRGIGLPLVSSTPRNKTPASATNRLSQQLRILSPVSGPAVRRRGERPPVTAEPPPLPPPELMDSGPQTITLQVLTDNSRSKKLADITDLDVLFDCIQSTTLSYAQRLVNPRCAQALTDLVEKTAWDVKDVIGSAGQIKKLKASERRAQSAVRTRRKALLNIQREYTKLEAEVEELREKAKVHQAPRFEREMASFWQDVKQLTESAKHRKTPDKQPPKIYSLSYKGDSRLGPSRQCRSQMKETDKQVRSWLQDNYPHTK